MSMVGPHLAEIHDTTNEPAKVRGFSWAVHV